MFCRKSREKQKVSGNLTVSGHLYFFNIGRVQFSFRSAKTENSISVVSDSSADNFA